MLELCGVLSLASLLVIVLFLFSNNKHDFSQAVKYAGYINSFLLLLILINDEREILFLKWE